MGRLAHAQRSRRAETHQRSKQRSRRSMLERTKRLDDKKEERKVKLVPVHHQIPSDNDAELLISQISQSCRLSNTSQALRDLIHFYSSGSSSDNDEKKESRKRGREEPVNTAALERMAEGFIKLQTIAIDQTENVDPILSDDDADDVLKTMIIEVMQSEYGERTLKSLLAALKTAGSPKFNDLANMLIEEFEENPSLLNHHIACRLMSALTFYGSSEMQGRILSLFHQQVRSEEDLIKMLRDNHTALTIGNLVKSGNKEASNWICETLSLLHPQKKKKVNDIGPKLLLLIEDPVASRVLRLLLNNSTRIIFSKYVDIIALMNSKRGSSFLRDLFTFDADDLQQEELSALTSAILEKIGDQLCTLAADQRANFVVQKIIALTTQEGVSGSAKFEALVRILSPQLVTLVSSKVGVHVVCALAEAALKSFPKLLESVSSTIISKSTVNDLLFCQTESLAIRAFMPIVKKESKTGSLLKGAIEHNMEELCFHEVGNLVVQKFFKEVGIPAASAFSKKIVKDQNYFLSMSRDPYASHVLFTLLDCTDPASHTALCNAIKNNAKALAVHVNGRFLVEKVIPKSSDLRSELLRQFLTLIIEKGTQHIFCTLVDSLDQRGIESLQNMLLPSLRQICTHQSGSIAVQKLMQSNQAIKAAIQRSLTNVDLRSELAHNYFGKFVIKIADS